MTNLCIMIQTMIKTILNQSQIPDLNTDQKQEIIVELSKLDFESLNSEQLGNLTNFIGTLPKYIMIEYLLRCLDIPSKITPNLMSHLRQFKDVLMEINMREHKF